MAGGKFGKTTMKWTPNGEKIKENVMAMKKKPYVKIGILEGQAEKPKKGDVKITTGEVPTLVEVATFHEFGTKTIPQRSFLRGTINSERSYFNQVTRTVYKQLMKGQTDVRKALGILGQAIQSSVQKKIRSGIDPELESATIKNKGSSTPLIDTGQLVNSIRYVIEEDGRGDKDGV